MPELGFVLLLIALGVAGTVRAERHPALAPAWLLSGVLLVVAGLAAWLAAFWEQAPAQAAPLSGWFVIAGVWAAGVVRASPGARALPVRSRWTMWGAAWLSPLGLLTLARALTAPQTVHGLPSFLTGGLMQLLFVTAFMLGASVLSRRVIRDWILP